MVVAGLRLVNFRSCCDASVRFGPGLNVVVGDNATGKTNLLEAAWFALRGGSPRTRRDEKLITWGERYARVELELETTDGGMQRVEVGFAPREGKRVRWDGVEVASMEDLRSRSHVFIFVPESLLLVKGSPARRRAHLDAFGAALDPQYAAAGRDLQLVVRQRNAQLAAVKQGAAPGALDPWDAQFARVATELGRRRRDLVAALSEGFSETAAALAPAGGRYALQLVAQLDGVRYDEALLLEELRVRRPSEVRRGLSLFGPQRDDLKFLEVGPDGERAGGETGGARRGGATETACGPAALPSGGRDLRLFGSQGEQRAAVLALLLAEQRLAAARTGRQGPLFLDDVMSELDDPRRRRLVRMLATAGQAVVTTTDRHYFTEEELTRATVVELPLAGSLTPGEIASPADDGTSSAPPGLDAL